MVVVVPPIVPKKVRLVARYRGLTGYRITVERNPGCPRNAVTVIGALEDRVVNRGLFISMLMTDEDPFFHKGFFFQESPTGIQKGFQ